jgi:hypothetical protein
MTTKLNSYILTDGLKEEMKRQLETSKQNKIEQGFDLCSIDSYLHAENICSGEVCKIFRKLSCSKGKYLGGFHTHPGDDSDLSIRDMISIYENKEHLSCIGGDKDNKISCYIIKKTPKEEGTLLYFLKNIYESDKILRSGMSKDKYGQYIKIVKGLQENYYHKVIL